MTKPNDIPQDVWDKATEVGLLGYLPEHVVESIARAIMAAKEEEREECAKIADIYAEEASASQKKAFDAGFDSVGNRFWSRQQTALMLATEILMLATEIRNRKLANNTNKD